MRRLLPIAAGVLFAVSAWAAPCAAQSAPSAGDIVISEVARRVLHDYYERNAEAWVAANPNEDGAPQGNGKKNKHKNNGGNGKPLPPGIAKKGALPPGIAKQLVRNGHLPPGLDYHELPPTLIVQLPPLAPEYRYVIADDRVMLIRAATNIILDVLQVPGV